MVPASSGAQSEAEGVPGNQLTAGFHFSFAKFVVASPSETLELWRGMFSHTFMDSWFSWSA